jgi:phenylacetate-coenzyme A ligase PaaK-like adenylate-forming protein
MSIALLVERVVGSVGWREKLLAVGIHPLELRALVTASEFERGSFLRSLPELTRGELRENALQFVSWEDSLSDALEWAWSSGSGGQGPLAVPRFPQDQTDRWLLRDRAAARVGIPFGTLQRLAFLCALPGRPEYRRELDALGHRQVERISLSRRTLPEVAERLREFAADAWTLSPVGLQWLLRASEEFALTPPKILFSTALGLPLALRRQAEDTWGVPVLDVYSSAETGPIALACPESERNFHVLEDQHWVEADAEGLLISRLSDSPLPLLRYRIHDRVTALSPQCPTCRQGTLTLVGFRGRTVSDKGERKDYVAPIAPGTACFRSRARSSCGVAYQDVFGNGIPARASAEISSK